VPDAIDNPVINSPYEEPSQHFVATIAPPKRSPVVAPEQGQLVRVRDRLWVVTDVRASQQPIDVVATVEQDPQHAVQLSSVEDDGLGEELTVIWEVEVGAQILESWTLPSPVARRFDSPERLDAFLDAVRWGAITSADYTALQAPFRSGITIEDYQLDPVVRALRMPRVNLLIADDVGLGKTIEAGLVIQELLLRHRARTVLVVCPAALCLKWQSEMQEKFGLEFRIVNSNTVSELRRTRGMQVNPWTSFPRLITSIDWLKRDRPMRLMYEVLPASTAAYPRAFDLLVVDEVHTVAPAGRRVYAVDSRRTEAIKSIVPHFEHRLFLSATPHNGYPESFSGLLELLDDQRFARGVRPTKEQLAETMVRRLKSELRESLPPREDGHARFARREIVPLEVDYTARERQVHADLVEYTNARRREVGDTAFGARAVDFVALLLKKRLFSSPAAFAKTLDMHMATLRRAHLSDEAPSGQTLERVIDRIDEEFDDDEELNEATEDALVVAARSMPPVTSDQRRLLSRMHEWADMERGRLDAKGEMLVEWLEGVVRLNSSWTDERVILFTEYRDTQRWLADHLTAQGLGGERLALLYGGMDEKVRERIKAEFQSPPSLAPVRILLATDAASEGIDLQRHCWRLIHVEIPFSPTRMEQRNGRVDRHGQPNPVVLIHHFVGAGWETAAAGSFEADLEFLSRAARKVEAIRDDLGSAAPVIAGQIEERMLGKRVMFDDRAIEQRSKAGGRLAKIERNLREEVTRLRDQLGKSRETLHVHPENVARVVSVGLELGRQAPLRPTILERPKGDNTPVAPVYEVPPLTHGWARTVTDLVHPVTGHPRPVTFDHEVADEHDDVVLFHVGHRLVQMAVRLLRAEVWSLDPTSGLSRVTARVVPDAALDELSTVVHARLVLVGADGHRLHEEVFAAGGRIRGGRFARFRTLAEMDRALSMVTNEMPSNAVLDRIVDEWMSVADPLYAALQVRAGEREDSLSKELQAREGQEVETIRGVLGDLRRRILTDIADPEIQQLPLQFDAMELDQLQRDREALRRRAEAIPEEIEREIEHIRARYAAPRRLVFPAAVTCLVPQRLAGVRS
jgi:superfamily II DNA or RNA helicase